MLDDFCSPIGAFSCPLCSIDCEGPTCSLCLQEITALFHPKIEGGRFYWFEKRNDSANILLKNRHYYRWPHMVVGAILQQFSMVKTGLCFQPAISIDSVITESNKCLAQHINFFLTIVKVKMFRLYGVNLRSLNQQERSHGSCFSK